MILIFVIVDAYVPLSFNIVVQNLLNSRSHLVSNLAETAAALQYAPGRSTSSVYMVYMNPMPVFSASGYTRPANDRKRSVFINGKLFNLVSPATSNENVKVVLTGSAGKRNHCLQRSVQCLLCDPGRTRVSQQTQYISLYTFFYNDKIIKS